MGVKLDQDYLLAVMKTLIDTPGPVSYYEGISPLLERFAYELGYGVAFGRRRTGRIKVPGEGTGKTICTGAHLDTLGLIVRRIGSDGMIQARNLGGINFNNIKGETVVVHTRNGKHYADLMACQSHSIHVFDNARTLIRDENTMMIILNEDVHSKEDVKALGIESGDIIFIGPRFTITEKGFIKSRFINDKICVACALAILKCLKEQNLTPARNTWSAFLHYEEIGHRSSYVPEKISEYIAVDITVIGPDHLGTEQTVSICAKGDFSPYDRELTDRLVTYTREAGINYVGDVFYRYGTDASAAVHAGNNVRVAAFGMGTFSSHGVERTHIKGVMQTAQLIAALVLQNS